MKKQSVIRKKALLCFGFGTDAMKHLTVCRSCSSLQQSSRMFCSRCSAKLSGQNLYNLYRSKHECCEKCKSVVSDSMLYCPNCGVRLKSTSEQYIHCSDNAVF